MNTNNNLEIPNYPNFTAIMGHHKPYIDALMKEFNPYCDFIFSNLYTWNPGGYETKLSLLNKNLIVKTKNIQTDEIELSMIGVNEANSSVLEILSENKRLSLMPHEILKHINNPDLIITEDPSNHDYILSTKDISELKGRSFLSKRKRINRFKREYPNHKVIILDKSNKELLDRVTTDVFNKWKTSKKSPVNYNERSEMNAIKRLIEIINYSDIEVWALEIDDDIKAFTTIEYINEDYALSSFAKTDLTYSDANAYLTYKTADYLYKEKNIKYLNHEQDLGMSNLRSEKFSWKPVNMLKKFIIKKND